MSPDTPREVRAREALGAAGPSLHVPADLARPLEESLGRGDFLRRLADLARSPEGGGASRVWILRARGGTSLVPVHEAPRWLASHELGSAPPAHEALDPTVGDPVVAEAWRARVTAWACGPFDVAPWGPAQALGAFPFRTDAAAEQLLVAVWDEPAPEAEARFVELARHARDAARRFELLESARRAEEQREALTAWLRAGAAAHHLSEALRAAGRAVLRASGCEMAALWTLGAEEKMELVATAGERRERESLARLLTPRAVIAATRAQAEIVEDAGAADAGAGPRTADRELPAGVSSAAFVPVAAYGRVLGVIAAFDAANPEGEASLDRSTAPAAPGDHELETLSAIADGLAMVLDRAQRTDAARTSEQQTRELRARLRRRERLASVGERASGALGEARHPLASIGAFARRAHRELAAEDPRREYLEVILRESERLERLIAESAEPGSSDLPLFRMESLNAVIQDVLPGVGEKLVRRRVRLLKRLDPESPRLLLDVERIRQVFRNVIERAVESVPVGGRVRVESRLVRDHVIAEVAYDGGHSPGDLLAELFVPFTPGAASQAPGLGVADQIIRRHGGEVRVRADGEWGATVLITLPVRGNEERRQAGEDRRLARTDRRQVVGSGG